MTKLIGNFLIIIICSLSFIGCDNKHDTSFNIINEDISKDELHSCIELGLYKGVIINAEGIKKVTDKDIEEQIEYVLQKAGETQLTNENVRSVSGYDSIDKYEMALRQSLEKMNTSSFNNQRMNLAWDVALDNAKMLKYPKSMLTEELINVKKSYESYALLLGVTYSELLDTLHKDDKDIEKEALDYVKSDLLVYAIAEKANLALSDFEISENISKEMKQYGCDTQEELFQAFGGEEEFHFVSLANKVMQYVSEHALVNFVEQ